MSRTILPLERARYREAAGVLARVFQNDPVAVSILKSVAPENRIKILTMSFDADLQVCGADGYPLEAVQEDKLAGAAIIHRPGAYPLSVFGQLSLLGMVLARGLTTTGAPVAFGRWLRWLNAIAGKHLRKPHIYLEFIGVEASFWGKGLGSQMLERLAERADWERMGSFLETGNPRDVPLFQRFGFQTTAKEEIIAVPTWFMWRPPIG
jgi:GNAT superfamily N-acetyltransferase